MNIKDCLRILEIDGNLDPKCIHRSYRRLVKRWHPDQFAHRGAIHAHAEERLKEINRAYLFLKNYLKKDHRIQSTASAPIKPDASQQAKTARQPQAGAPPGFWPWLKRMGRYVYQQTQNGAHTNRPYGSPKLRPKRSKPNFEHILKEAGRPASSTAMRKNRGAHPIYHAHLPKRRRRGMSIEGTDPVTPISPIRPVSGIHGIGEPD